MKTLHDYGDGYLSTFLAVLVLGLLPRFTVEFDDIYDYVHFKPDGTEAGNETGKVLLRREGK